MANNKILIGIDEQGKEFVLDFDVINNRKD